MRQIPKVRRPPPEPARPLLLLLLQTAAETPHSPPRQPQNHASDRQALNYAAPFRCQPPP